VTAFDVLGVQPRFTGYFADNGFDANGDGLLDEIDEAVGLANLPTGSLLLAGDLVDPSGYQLGHAVSAVSRAADGTGSVILRFDVSAAGCAQFGGPLRVSSLILADAALRYQIIDAWSSPVSTAVYSSSSFRCGGNAAPAPTISSVSPGRGVPGSTILLQIAGSGFLPGATCSVGPYSPSMSPSVSAQQIVVEWVVPGNAPLGPLPVSVTNPDGSHAVADGAFAVLADSPPAVAITQPLEHTGVIGRTVVSAQATDDGSIQYVDFLLDGFPLSTASLWPYRVMWDSSSAASGPHVLTAVAYDDQSQHTSSQPVDVVVCSALSSATARLDGSYTTFSGHSVPLQVYLQGTAPWRVRWSDGVVQDGLLTTPATRSVAPGRSTTYYLAGIADATGCPGSVSGSAIVDVLTSGDVNGDGLVNIADVFYLINYLFAGGSPPLGAADVNSDLSIDLLDVFYLINYLFAGGPSPL
jgi:hypothetical protein